MQMSSRAVMFWGCRWATRTFNSLHRFSTGLRSGDWLGHSGTLKCFLGPKSSILVSSDHMTFSQSSSGSSKCSLANFRRAWTCTGLSRGTRLALLDLSPWRRSVLLMVAFVTLVPALCRSLGPPEIISGLVCLPFSNNCSHSWFLHTKLRTYCRFSLPSLVQVYNLVSGVLW